MSKSRGSKCITSSPTEVPPIFSLSNTAGEHLASLLAEANAPDDSAIRFVVEGDGYNLVIGTVRPGDTTFDHDEKVVLVIDEQVADLLADMMLVVKVTGGEPELEFKPADEGSP